MRFTGFTQYIDVAQIVLYAFWIFFFALLVYLRREDKREGYPLEADPNDRARPIAVRGFPSLPRPKVFRLDHGGGTVMAPGVNNERQDLALKPKHRHTGSPMEPTGDPMQDGVGPASYAMRADRPDLTLEGTPKIVPMRSAGEFFIPSSDPNPIGLSVYAADGKVAGRVSDVWIDLAEPQIRYLEVAVESGGQAVLVPVGFADLGRRRVTVDAVLSGHFANAPRTAHPDQVTLLEEDKISAYFGGGTLYATPARKEPLL